MSYKRLFHKIRAESAAAAAAGICVECKAPFSDKNTHTTAGWKETQISGMCEDCFDRVTAEPWQDGFA